MSLANALNAAFTKRGLVTFFSRGSCHSAGGQTSWTAWSNDDPSRRTGYAIGTVTKASDALLDLEFLMNAVDPSPKEVERILIEDCRDVLEASIARRVIDIRVRVAPPEPRVEIVEHAVAGSPRPVFETFENHEPWAINITARILGQETHLP